MMWARGLGRVNGDRGACSGPLTCGFPEGEAGVSAVGFFVTAQQPTCFPLKEHDEGEPRVGGGFQKASEVLRC